ncbi:hypothetical protein, partial [Salmonella sp. SAL4445]|uniref:hypothetical protein n=1 Tax=Salmonella sp. SAL4445 TaxID=3159900 RepID=UPI00397B5AE9
PEHLIDAKVRIRGVCGALFNDKRQLLGIQIHIPGLDYISMVEPAPADPFSGLVRPIDSLLQYTPGEILGHRVRVQGIATYQR